MLEREEKERVEQLAALQALQPVECYSLEEIEKMSTAEKNNLRSRIFANHEVTQYRTKQSVEKVNRAQEIGEGQIKVVKTIVKEYNAQVDEVNDKLLKRLEATLHKPQLARPKLNTEERARMRKL